MTGDTPDDLDARRVANEKVVREAIATHYAGLPPLPPVPPLPPIPPYDAGFVMPGTPFAPAASAPPHRDQRMSENGAGQYQALRVEVEGVKGQFHDFKEDVNGKLTGLQNEIRTIGTNIADFIQNQGNRGGDNLVKIGGMIIGAIGIAMAIASAFGSMANAQLSTNIVFTNEKITALTAVMKDNFSGTNTTSEKLAGLVEKLADKNDARFDRLTDKTIPKEQLDAQLKTLTETQKTKVDKDVLQADEKRYDDAMARFGKDVVSREEHAEHWRQDAEHFQALGNRVEDLMKSSASASVLQEQMREQGARLTDLQRKVDLSLQGRPRYLEPINGTDNPTPPR